MATTTPAEVGSAPVAGSGRQPVAGDRPYQLYGIIPAEVTTTGLTGLPAGVEFVRYRNIAAITRVAPTDTAGQLRSYLLAYAELLDRLAADWPVLPIRFGTTVPSTTAVVRQVLAPRHDASVAALTSLTGKAQFTVRIRYLPEAIIREILAEQPAAARLRRSPPLATGETERHGPRNPDQLRQFRLGELIANAVTAKRSGDIEWVCDRLRRHVVTTLVQPAPSLELARVADLTCLVDKPHRAGFEAAMADLAEHWRDRARLRLLGPMAPYHFVDNLAGEPAGRW